MIIETFPAGPLQCNCTILIDGDSAIIVDPGGDADAIIKRLTYHSINDVRMLHTHAHFDHFLASEQLRRHYTATLALHRDDLELWRQLEWQCKFFGVPYTPTGDPDTWIEHEQEFRLGPHICQALHTPGHTQGSVSFLVQDQSLLIAGDTLFEGSIGRTDLPGGNSRQILSSIRERLYTLDEATKVITGHGPSTSIGHEMRHNRLCRA
jgi:glyoxylase-like metal-dependent hydrolase (beta-lactamase superfamily II)